MILLRSAAPALGNVGLRSSSLGATPLRNIAKGGSAAFSTGSAVRFKPASSSPLAHPNHPHALYMHPTSSGSNTYAISLLSAAPSTPTAASIIGTFKSQSSSSSSDDAEELFSEAESNPNRVSPNPAFVTLLHDTLKNVCIPQDGLMQYEAALRGSGWVHASDPRHPLMPGRIPTPENIFGTVAFTEGELRPESYEVNDTYRIVTAEEGFMQLRPHWHPFVCKACEEVN